MGLLRHFDFTPDQADASVRFELRNQEPRDDAEARVALTVVDLEADGGEEQGRITVELSPRDVDGLIDALEQTLDELEPRGAEEEEEAEAKQPEPQQPSGREEQQEAEAEQPAPQQPSGRPKAAKSSRQDGKPEDKEDESG